MVRKNSVLSPLIIVLILGFLLIGCSQNNFMEWRVRNSGVVQPGDRKEEIIFAYFQALQEARYQGKRKKI